MRRWYLIDYGMSPARRLAADARDAVQRFLDGSILEARDIVRVLVDSTGEVVPEDLWRPVLTPSQLLR